MYFLQKFNAVEKLEIFRKTERNKPKNFYMEIKILARMRFSAVKILEGADKAAQSVCGERAKVQGLIENIKKENHENRGFKFLCFGFYYLMKAEKALCAS